MSSTRSDFFRVELHSSSNSFCKWKDYVERYRHRSGRRRGDRHFLREPELERFDFFIFFPLIPRVSTRFLCRAMLVFRPMKGFALSGGVTWDFSTVAQPHRPDNGNKTSEEPLFAAIVHETGKMWSREEKTRGKKGNFHCVFFSSIGRGGALSSVLIFSRNEEISQPIEKSLIFQRKKRQPVSHGPWKGSETAGNAVYLDWLTTVLFHDFTGSATSATSTSGDVKRPGQSKNNSPIDYSRYVKRFASALECASPYCKDLSYRYCSVTWFHDVKLTLIEIGSTFTAWTVRIECSSRRRRWSAISSGTRSAMNRCSTVSCVTRRATTATTATPTARTTASKLTIIASKYFSSFLSTATICFMEWSVNQCFFECFMSRQGATRCTSARRTSRCTPTTTGRTRPSSRRASSGSGRRKTAPRPIVRSMDSAPRTSTAGERRVITRSKIRPIWVSQACFGAELCHLLALTAYFNRSTVGVFGWKLCKGDSFSSISFWFL